MKKALLLHGWGSTIEECWFPWLKNELESKGYEVCMKNLPSTQYPVLEDQFSAIKDFAEQMQEGDVIVGHSLGGTLAAQTIEKLELTGLKVILVAPTYPLLGTEIKEKLGKHLETLNAYYGTENTFYSLKNKYTVFLSDDDPYINMESAKNYYNNFLVLNSVEFREFHKMDHFSDDAVDPVKQLPEILEYL